MIDDIIDGLAAAMADREAALVAPPWDEASHEWRNRWRAAARTGIAHLANRAAVEAGPEVAWCPLCGRDPECDAHQRCVSCGSSTGTIPDARVLRAQLTATLARVAELEAAQETWDCVDCRTHGDGTP